MFEGRAFGASICLSAGSSLWIGLLVRPAMFFPLDHHSEVS